MLGMDSGSSGNGSFIKRSLTGAILTMFLMAAFLSIFLPDQYEGEDMEEELATLTGGYYAMTGSSPVSEEVWGLSGIYTPYGKDEEGADSTAWGTTPDGWVYGSRIAVYAPSQLLDLNNGKESYTVMYDVDTGLYYYTAFGEDLEDSLKEGDPSDPENGTLYTSVAMDKAHRSNVFFTPGTKVTEDGKGSYYAFSGWRYVWQPLRDYKASNDLNVDKTTTSLSMVWYDYYGSEGLSGQLMLCGSDSGVSYITTKEITEEFDSASFSSKFEMIFNGITMNIYIKLNPWAIQFGGMSPANAFNEGYWSIMVTSPSVTTDTAGFTLQAFSPDRLVEIVFNLLTFSMDGYGLSGTASILCSLFFTVGFYTSLIAICVEHIHLLILMTALVGVLQGIAILT